MVLLAISGCDAGKAESRLEQVEDLCVTNCLKPLCAANIFPSPDTGDRCRDICEMQVVQVEEDQCLEDYEALLVCLDEAECVDYYAWYEGLDEAPCVELEAEVTTSCSPLELRDPLN